METEGIALRTANPSDRIALRGVRVRSRLTGMSQRTTLEQTFVNLESKPIEALYTFPLPEGAAVCGFQIITGDRVLTGEVDVASLESQVSAANGGPPVSAPQSSSKACWVAPERVLAQK